MTSEEWDDLHGGKRPYNPMACDFVDNHQLPSDQYGIGEGNEMDWDEHVQTWFSSKIDDPFRDSNNTLNRVKSII